MRIVVIGSGFGGLSAALRLRMAGHDVTVVDSLDKPGGRAYVYEQDGFRFDAGPTILTAPWLVQELFEVAGKRMVDYVQLVSLDPLYNIRFEDGSVFRYTADRARLVREIRRFNPGDVAGYVRLSRAAERLHDAVLPLMDQPFTGLSDLLRTGPRLLRAGAHRSLATLVESHIQDPRLRRVFSFQPILVGASPYRCTSAYALIHTLEQRWGVWYPMGGIGALVQALAGLFVETGGVLQLGAEATEIVVDPATRLATGVRLASRAILPADAVVSNADIASTYLRLVPARYRRVETDRRIKRRSYSMSHFVLYFGTDRRYDDMAHHEMLMGPRYRGWLDDISARSRLPADFSLYLHRPTATDPTVAPPGCDTWYAMASVPHLGSGTDWGAAARPYRDAIVRYLESRYLPGLSQHIVTERVVDPRHFQHTLNSYLGSASSVEPTVAQSAWRRPHNQSADVRNLYAVGAGTHPGAGVPSVIASGKIVARLIGAAH